MRKRWYLGAALSCTIALAFAAGVAQGKGPSFKRLNAAGRSDLPFSDAIVAGDTIYIAGTLGIDPETGKPPTDPEAEARLVLDGIAAKLALAHATMDDLVAVQVFCPDLALYDGFNAVYRTYFQNGYPTRSFIGSGPLLRGARFEVNGIAIRRR